jgi:predicted DCC family thiol-disulfide oxidoreductase YuxK
LEFLPYQRALDPPVDDELRAACERAMHVVTPSGEVLRAGRGSLFVLAQLDVAPWLMRLAAAPPFLWIVELGYLIVARNRSFFGRFLFRREQDPGAE